MHLVDHLPPSRSDRPHIKVCGLRRREDALLAARLGARFLGLVLARDSPRYVRPAEGRDLMDAVRAEFGNKVTMVGVFRDEPIESIADTASRMQLDVVQIHQNLAPKDAMSIHATVVPAFGVGADDSDLGWRSDLKRAQEDYPAVLLDSKAGGRSGGTGKVFDHRAAASVIPRGRVFIAGGIGPQNIEALAPTLRTLSPYAIDLSGSLESQPGVKSVGRIQLFFALWDNLFPKRRQTEA